MKKRKMLKNILVIRSGAIGDVIMSTPFLRNLRQNFPKAKISYLVGKWSKDVLRNNPNADEIISFDDDIYVKKQFFNVLKLIAKLRKRSFDLCFILDKSWIWNMFAFLIGIKKRIGFSRGREGIWNTDSVKFEGRKHEIDYNLDLLKKVKIKPVNYEPEIFSSKKDKQYASDFIDKIGNKGRIIGIAPGGAINPGQDAYIKRWPKERYLELTKLNYNFIIFGGKEDKEIADYIISDSKNKNIYNSIGNSPQQARELMKECDIIITHDSGAMHIASTTNTKLIVLFGPTPAKRFAPLGSYVISKKGRYCPCYDIYGNFKECEEKNCMEKIKVEEVIKIAQN